MCERKRDFQPHWLKQFSWLENNSSSAGGAADRRDDDAVVDVEGGESDGTAKTELSMRMFCKYCCKYEKAGSFVVGSPVFKWESIKAHNSSASHMNWALREKESREQQRLCPSSAMVQLTTATPRPNWRMFSTVTKGQSMSTLLG